jgi:hypothetical protein
MVAHINRQILLKSRPEGARGRRHAGVGVGCPLRSVGVNRSSDSNCLRYRFANAQLLVEAARIVSIKHGDPHGIAE